MKKLKLGTRGSPLALKQADMVCQALVEHDPDLEVEIVKIVTSGEWKPAQGEKPLKAEQGGKALFAKEIEEALLSGRIDIAVHSMKDMESVLPDGLIVPWMLPRADVRDVLIVTDPDLKNVRIDDLPANAIVGTTSPRRHAYLKHLRADLEIVPFRGNVQTRIDKVRRGQVQASLLAYAGLQRLGLEHEIGGIIEVEEMLPAAAQGAIGIEICAERFQELSFIGQISDLNTVLCVECERAALRVLGGSCQTAIGAYAYFDGDDMKMRICMFDPHDNRCFEASGAGKIQTIEGAQSLGAEIARRLKVQCRKREAVYDAGA